MIGLANLFTRLTCEIEDLHALAIEGRSADLPADATRIVLGHFCNGLQRIAAIAVQIDIALGDPK